MELKTWKMLLSASLISGLMGLYLLLLNLTLAIVLMTAGIIGLLLLALNRWGIILGRFSWLFLSERKREGKLPEDLEQEKMPAWLLAWILGSPFICMSALFLLYTGLWSIGILLFYGWVTSAVLIALYSHVIKY